jgi:hypothetical protein
MKNEGWACEGGTQGALDETNMRAKDLTAVAATRLKTIINATQSTLVTIFMAPAALCRIAAQHAKGSYIASCT